MPIICLAIHRNLFEDLTKPGSQFKSGFLNEIAFVHNFLRDFTRHFLM